MRDRLTGLDARSFTWSGPARTCTSPRRSSSRARRPPTRNSATTSSRGCTWCRASARSCARSPSARAGRSGSTIPTSISTTTSVAPRCRRPAPRSSCATWPRESSPRSSTEQAALGAVAGRGPQRPLRDRRQEPPRPGRRRLRRRHHDRPLRPRGGARRSPPCARPSGRRVPSRPTSSSSATPCSSAPTSPREIVRGVRAALRGAAPGARGSAPPARCSRRPRRPEHAVQRRDRPAPPPRLRPRRPRRLQAGQERARRHGQRRRPLHRRRRAGQLPARPRPRHRGAGAAGDGPGQRRAEAEHGALGNRVSAMMAPLPVWCEDPVERLRLVPRRWAT